MLIVTLLLSACQRTSTSAGTTPTPAAGPSQISWTACGTGFQCGSVPVPLDYSNPGSGTIEIALIRKPATDQAHRIGSVLTNPGGPGASGIDFLRGEASIMGNLNQRLDLIGFDPRGVGQSAPVRCLDGPHEDALNALDSVLDDPAEKQAAIDADKAFASGCGQLSARVLPFVDTVSAARDMDVIRAALGDAKLTYLGFSYGTFLGENYAHLFPTHVRALVLDGVIDPTLQPNDLLYAQLVGFEKNLQAWLSDCRAHKASVGPCVYAKSGDPETKLMNLMQRLDANPIPVGARELTRGLAVIGVITALYDQSTWSLLDTALSQTDAGDGTFLLQLADYYLGRNANGTYDNETDANIAVNCLDRPVPTSIATYDALGPSFARASKLFGPAFQYSNLTCAYWPVKVTGSPGVLTADGAPPILLVGGTNDPATPYSWAQAAHRQISGSILLTRNGNGHVSYDKSACAKEIEEAYLISLTLPAEGTIC